MSWRNKRKCNRSLDSSFDSPISTPPRKSTPKRPRKAAIAAAAAIRGPEVINLLEDNSEIEEFATKVDEKVDTFFKSGNFTISSDEDDGELMKAQTNKNPKPDRMFVSDDPDDDCKEVPANREYDPAMPGTSSAGSNAPTSTGSETGPNVSIFDDIMFFVDDILKKKNPTPESEPPITDIKSLEDYRKETEEMLKNATTLLNKFKSPEEHESSEEDVPEVEDPQIVVGSCPICLESMAGKSTSVTVCGHIFCTHCIKTTAKAMKKCPVCRKAINLKKIHPVYF